MIQPFYRKATDPLKPSPLPFMNVPYRELKPETLLLKRGTKFIDGGRSLPCDIIVERDAPVRLRDGVTIYVDIFRPLDQTDKIPAIIAWSPYGKNFPQEPPPGVERSWVSGLQKFEGPDPAYWCSYGYAIVNVDTRGAFNSEGDIHFWGPQDAIDGYDVIEWVANQEWCNGRVGLSGNSWLAIAQWFIAAENPPHLFAIAPWEGLTDLYRHDVGRGGIPNPGFNELITISIKGKNRIEDIPEMLRMYPLMNEYWQSKIPKLKNINVPAYIVASWSNDLHTLGTLEGFRLISSKKKWLRVHNTHEWQDYYSPENVEDLRKFFDRYLKDVQNQWEETPVVRVSVLNPGGTDIVDRNEEDWPIPHVSYKKLFLNSLTGSLELDNPSREGVISYCADDGHSRAVFEMSFQEDTEMIGYIKLHLFVEARGSEDMDLYALLEKVGEDGRPLHVKTPVSDFFGATGMLRISQREKDLDSSTEWLPIHTHKTESLLRPGEIVPCEICLWPLGMRWKKGEKLRLTLCGFNPVPFHIPNVPKPILRNRGLHVIYTGGKFESYLLVPEIKNK